MRLEHIVLGRRPPAGLAGAVLTRDLVVGGQRWPKGRRLSADDLRALGEPPRPDDRVAGGLGGRRDDGPAVPGREVTVLVLEPGDLHEDEAALRLAAAVGRGSDTLTVHGPHESRVDLRAAVDGVVGIRIGVLERLNAIDPLEVFTVWDGQTVRPGDLVASLKVSPHAVPEGVVARAEALAARGAPVVVLRPFGGRRVGVVVKETLGERARTRFEASIGAKLAGLGAEPAGIHYVADHPVAVGEALAGFATGPEPADLVLTAGGASTDPSDAFFVALDRLGGRVVRRGVPSHPGSMLWLGRLRRTTILGLPTCGAYSKATAADLLLPRLLAGEPPTAATVARLGHGGILTRDQRFRFPPYARELDAPEG